MSATKETEGMAKMIRSFHWDSRDKDERRFLVNQAARLGLDIGVLRAEDWGCTPHEARVRVFAELGT